MKRFGLLLLIAVAAHAQMPGPMPPGRFVRAGGYRLHYYCDGRGPVVLFLHGFGGNGTNWSSQFPALRVRFTVIALDQLGFGESSKPHLAYNADVLAESAIHFLDALHIERAAIVGASMGGDVAARIAAKHPRRVERLILMDASGDDDPSDPAPPPMPVDPTTAADQEAILRVLIYDQSRVTPELIQQRLAAHLAAGDSYTRRHFSGAPVDLPELLPKIVAPTLLIWGEHDRLVPLAAACRFRSDIATSKLVIIPNAAHVPQMEQPETFNSVLARFLDGASVHDERAERCTAPR